jgi:hypothetical protein
VEFHSLPASSFAFFEALARGETLGSALDCAQALDRGTQKLDCASAKDTGFDLAAALRHLMGLRILTAVRLSEPPVSRY